MSSNLSNSIEKKTYDAIVSSPFVTVYDTKKLNIYREGLSLQHCVNVASREKMAEWVIDFDIDEVFAFGPSLQTKEECNKNTRSAAGALAAWASELPNGILAVVIPRVRFGQNGIVNFTKKHRTQMDLYTRRERDVHGGSKILLRANSSDHHTMLSGKHAVEALGRYSVIYPSGQKVEGYGCKSQQEGDGVKKDDICKFRFNSSSYPSEAHLAAPRLHHYTRSFDECELKLRDLATAPWHNSSGMSPWRLQHAETVCDPNALNNVADFSLFCDGMAAAKELNQLFPSWA